MYQVSQRFLDTVASGVRFEKHVMRVLRGDDTIDVPIESAGVSVDLTAAIRRDFSATVINEEYVPLLPTDTLSPYGNRVQIWSGFAWADGTEELVPQGVFTLLNSNTDEHDGDISVGLSGLDLAERVQVPSARGAGIDSGTSVPTAIARLIRQQLPDAKIRMAVVPWVTPALYYPPESDLWLEGMTLATGAGLVVYPDVEGYFVIEPAVRAMDRWYVPEFIGGVNAVVTDITRSQTSDRIFNGVIVIGDHSSLATPVRGEAWDMDPTSPTYRFGRLGERAKTVRSKVVVDTGQAFAAAAGLLASVLGPSDVLNITCVPNWALAEGDVVRVTRPGIGASGLYVIARIRSPQDLNTDMELEVWKRINA